MRIDRLHIRNFKCFEDHSLDLDPRFTLLVGDNGAGKTTVLDALAVAAGIWLVNPPDSTLVNSGRNILRKEFRLVPRTIGDRTLFEECKPVSVEAEGEIAGRAVLWCRGVGQHGVRTSNAAAKKALGIIDMHFADDRAEKNVLSPVIAYYGAGRTWLPSRDRSAKGGNKNDPLRRWNAFYDCLAERIRLSDLQRWFHREAIAASTTGNWRPGYKAVENAILRCLPDAKGLHYDGDREDIVLSVSGKSHPFTNLSAGQRMMIALIADIAIKAVMQNPHLVVNDSLARDGDRLPNVLQQAPGLVLIDELDAHLHPRWQRRVVDDLKNTFPGIQFVCASHSPFVIQSLKQGELRTVDRSGSPLVEYANCSIEDIAEDVQYIKNPQQSRRAQMLADATEHYFNLLQQENGSEASTELKEAEATYRRAAERYSANPGLSAILKLEALAKHKRDSK